jgi:hypothetical protein
MSILPPIPVEGYQRTGDRHFLKLTVMPLVPTTCPPDVVDPPANKIFGKILTQPGLDQAVVNNIAGMSGGPIFGLKPVGGKFHYWVIGIQSSWFENSRIVCFCPAFEFFTALKEAIRRIQAGELPRAATEEAP